MMSKKIKKIAVLGAGQMGSGIAQVCATSSYQVTLLDVSKDQLAKAKTHIEKNLTRQVEKERLTPNEMKSILSHLSFAEALSSPDIDLFIEAVSENFDLKAKLLKQYSDFLKPEALMASNTSSLSITQLATQTNRPEKFIGMHFMNPVPVMQLIEVIRSLMTSDDTFQAIQEVVSQLNKTLVLSEDYPGFIVNRILMPMINEAIFTLHEGIASAKDIDTAMMLGTNQPMGPLALADFIGLDTCLSICQVLHNGFKDSKYRPCPLLVNYVNAGWLGRKTGRGFYMY